MTETERFSFDGDQYSTEPRRIGPLHRLFPSFNFYRQFLWLVSRSSARARRGEYDGPAWSESSHRVLHALESVGVEVAFEGLDHIRGLSSSCVFVGNHMSMFETIILPAVIQPITNVTFVVKQSLLDYPVFRHILRSRNPIGVSRDNPREDLKAVLGGGVERIQDGISIVVFPQTTRSLTFEAENFNTIGVKLAARAGVPIVPVALITDAWGNGKWIKDLGPITPSKKVHIAFGEPITVSGRGTDEHQQVIRFIEGKLAEWGRG
ncbi:MAG: lysophospholipid acyltransferase family protein [Planctomycetota bacterium]